MKHFLWSLVLVFLAAAPAWSSPNFVPINRPPSTSGGTLLFLTGDTADSQAIGVSGYCTVRFEQSSGDDVSLYAVTSSSTAASSGTLLKAFTSSTSPSNPAYTFTASTQYVKAKAVDATTGGSKLIIECNPTFGSSGGGGGSFDACRSGSTQGGGYSATDGRWAWTCGNYPWREWQDATAANSASYTVDCESEGVPHTSCLRAAETRYIGYGLNVSVAAQYTRDGGRVYLPEGIYVDNGAGDNEAGDPTDFPHPYDPSWEARSDFAAMGYPTALRVILLNRGVRLVGEGIPKAVTYDPGDSTVTDQTPKLTGTWIVDDRGVATDSSATSTPGGAGEDIDPPSYYRMLVGGNPYTSYCHTDDADADSDGVLSECITDDTTTAYKNAQEAPNGANAWGVDIPLLADYTSSAVTVCLPDVTYDLSTLNSQADAIGTCSGNRMIRCWDTDDSSEPRSTGGCYFDADEDYGTCQAPFEALKADYTTAGQDLQLALGISECADDATAHADCDSPLGWDIYINDLRAKPGVDITGSACASNNGTTVSLGNAWSTYSNDFYSRSIPFPNFYINASNAANRIMVIKRGAMDGKGAGFENIGRMPANWLTRDSAVASNDCLSGGAASDSDDEAACDTDTLSGFAMSYNNLIGPNNLYFKASQYLGKSAVVETYPSGGPNDFVGNKIDTVYRQTAIDWGWGNASFNTATNLFPWAARYAWAACYGGKCTFEGNRIDNSLVSNGYLGYTAAQEMVVKNEKYSNVLGDSHFFQLNAVKNFTAENLDFGYFGYHTLGIITTGGITKQRPTVSFKNISAIMNRVGVQSSTTPAAGVHPGGHPVTAFLIESDTTADSRVDTFKSIKFDQINIKSLTDDMCLLWIDDDRYSDGNAGGAVDTAALTVEGANRIEISNSNLIGTGGGSDNPAIACIGQYRYIAAAKDADDARAWAFERYTPSLINNYVNNLSIPNMLPTISAAQAGDADNVPRGTVVRIHDGTGTACAHTNGLLTAVGSPGTSVESCVADPATSGSSTDGTWTAF